MKCKVQLFKAGTVFEEIVIATDYDDAKKVALARNPGATIMGVTAVFPVLSSHGVAVSYSITHTAS